MPVRRIRSLSLRCSLLFVVLVSANSVHAQKAEPSRKQREAATQDLGQCIEIEKVGDATACWKLWLSKYENIGSLAEVTLAREHVARTAGNSGALPASSADATAQAPPTQPVPTNSVGADQVTTAEFDKQVAEAMGEPVEAPVEQPLVEPPAVPKVEPTPVVQPAVAAPAASAGSEKPVEQPVEGRHSEEGPNVARQPKSGLSIQPQLAIAAAFNNYGRSSMLRSDGSLEYGLRTPSLLMGGGVAVGYDLGPSTGWTDTHLRLSGSYLHGSRGVEMSANLVPIDITIEKGYHMGSRLLWYGAAGWTGTIIEVNVLNSPAGVGPTGTLNSFAWGGLLRAGVEVPMTHSLAFRAELFTRLNAFGGEYKASQKDPRLADFDRRQDYFSELGLTLGLNLMP